MPATDASDKTICSFCGKSQDEVRKMVAGPKGIFICDECVFLSLQITSENGGLHERAAYFSYLFVVKLLYPLGQLLNQFHLPRKSN